MDFAVTFCFSCCSSLEASFRFVVVVVVVFARRQFSHAEFAPTRRESIQLLVGRCTIVATRDDFSRLANINYSETISRRRAII